MKQMKHKILLLLFFPTFGFLSGNDIDDLLKQFTSRDMAIFINEALIEPVEKKFSEIDGSENFIRQFTLAPKEEDIIGGWGFNGVITSPKEGDGPGTTIYFLPNRYFYIYKTGSNELNVIKYVVGFWKVENDILMLNFLCRLRIVNVQTKDMSGKYIIEYMNDNIFHPVFPVPEYEKYFLNTKPFDWTAIPETVRNFYGIKLNDSPRGRLLFDTLGIPPGDLGKESRIGSILLAPRETDSYIFEIVNIW